MKNLQEATEKICELKGSLVALETVLTTLLTCLPAQTRSNLDRLFARHAEVVGTVMLHTAISEHSIAAYERDVSRLKGLIHAQHEAASRDAVEQVLLTTASVTTFLGHRRLSGASGFFFERDGRLYLVTSRHVLIDEATEHFPDRIEIEMHTDEVDLTRSIGFSIPLYQQARAVWRQARDAGGPVDVAVIELDRQALPGGGAWRSLRPENLQDLPPAAGGEVEVGSSLLILGFPLGFHDTLHHLPVARNAVVASSYGTRFQGQGYFLTDARTHRGSSGAPVLLRQRDAPNVDGILPWKLLGVHSARLDMRTRDLGQDETLGLNCAWYADILLPLTAA